LSSACWRSMIFSYILCLVVLGIGRVSSTAMDDYVWKEDPNYSWYDTGEEIHGRNVDGSVRYVGYVLNMTSQRWLTDEDTSRSLWWHTLVVIVPSNYDKTYSRNATLWITDGDNGDSDPISRTNYNMLIASELAMGTGMIVASLFHVPNQHMVFSSDPEQKSRSEDAIIAFTWAHFLDNPDEPEWLVRLPMVKASLRAMDTVSAFVAQKRGLMIPDLDYYVVSGASKRGWTTWCVGAVDQTGRVTAIVPVVLDAINFVDVEHHQYRSYGGWSYFLEDYYEQNITARYDEPNMRLLQEIEDPYFYKERLTMPKLVINGGQDEFQQPDDTHYWWADMPGPKHFLMMPNTDHMCILGIGQAIPTMGTWIRHLVRGKEIPEVNWVISEDTGDITATVTSSIQPNVTMWYARTCGLESPARRDFRLLNLDDPCQCGVAFDGQCLNQEASRWYSLPLAPNSKGQYVAHVDAVEGQWTAFFIDFTFPYSDNEEPYRYSVPQRGPDSVGPRSRFFKAADSLHTWPRTYPGQLDFTTEVSVWPNTFPFEDCHDEGCYGTLL